MNREVMLDLETLSLRPNAVILSIGAVGMDMDKLQKDGTELHVTVDLEDVLSYGDHFHISGDTIKWWLKQGDEARASITQPACVPLRQALREFKQFANGDYVWGNGCSFDNVILRNAYHVNGMDPGFSSKMDRDYRTIKYLVPVDPPERGANVLHNALDDARWQADHLFMILRKIRGQA